MRVLHLLTLGLLAWTHAGWHLALRLARRGGVGRVTDDREAARATGGEGPTAAGRAATGGEGSTAARGTTVGGPAEPGARRAAAESTAGSPAPTVTVVVAAYAEEDAIGATVARLRAQTHPADRLQIVVACDGSPDRTAERARAAGADVVLELPRGGKHAAQAAGVARATGEVLAFSDANTLWEPDALAELVAAFADPRVGYACGRVTFVAADGATNQEGAYWRLEMALRRLESDLWSVTAGNGAIYAVRAALWPRLRTDFGHDLALPHQTVRAGMLATDRPTARASEPMVPTVAGEWRRKRRMMNQMWRVVLRGGEGGGLRGGVLDPRDLPPAYLAALVSHRWLRYASPFLHVVALLAGLVAARRGRRLSVHRLLLGAHLALFVGAAAAEVRPSRPFLLCRYYVLMTASIAAGLEDHLRHGTPAGWEPAEGTR